MGPFPVLLIELPETDYATALQIQRGLVRRKLSTGGPDTVILLEHPPTITLGTRARRSDLLLSEREFAARGIQIHSSDRGGQATYHGPGQLVCYPILDLRRMSLSVRDYVSKLEETVIRTLALFGVAGLRMKGKPGVWTGDGEKIASIGVRLERRVTSHGFSLNVNLTVDPAQLIIACGDPGTRAVNLQELADEEASMDSVRAATSLCLTQVFGITLKPAVLDDTIVAFSLEE